MYRMGLDAGDDVTTDIAVRFRLAWFAGVNLRILEKAKSEIGFYNALGAMVVLLSCASGFAAALAVGYMLQVPASEVWWVGVAWALILACGIERLVLQVATTSKAWLAVVVIPRVLLSVVLAVQLGEPLILRINEGEINNYISNKETVAKRAAESEARSFYSPEIATDRKELTGLQQQEEGLEQKIEENEFLSDCEAGTASCSHTGRTGCGVYCAHYSRLAEHFRERLHDVEGLNQKRRTNLEGELERLRGDRGGQQHERKAAINGSGGLAAHEQALAALAGSNSEIAAEIWVLRLFFLCLDLLPLSAKVLRTLTVESPYEEHAAAERKEDGVEAKRSEEAARVEERKIEEQGRADIEVARREINLDAARRMGEADSTADASAGTDPATPVPAFSLGNFVKRMEPHEVRPVAVPAGLRRSGMVGVALIAGLGALSLLWTALTGHSVAGLWLVAVALGLALGLMAYTRGFNTAPAWALRATMVTFFAGLVLPMLVFIANV